MEHPRDDRDGAAAGRRDRLQRVRAVGVQAMATQSRAGGAAPQGSCLLSRGRSDRASRRGLRPSMEGGADAGKDHGEVRQPVADAGRGGGIREVQEGPRAAARGHRRAQGRDEARREAGAGGEGPHQQGGPGRVHVRERGRCWEHREGRQRGGMRREEGVKGTLVKVAYVAGPMLALCALIRLAEVAAVALGLALGTL